MVTHLHQQQHYYFALVEANNYFCERNLLRNVNNFMHSVQNPKWFARLLYPNSKLVKFDGSSNSEWKIIAVES